MIYLAALPVRQWTRDLSVLPRDDEICNNNFDWDQVKIWTLNLWTKIQLGMLKRANATTNNFINIMRRLQRTQMLQWTSAATNECYSNQMLQRTVLSIKSGSYNEHRRYNERMVQRTVFINQIRKLQRTQMLQRTVFFNKMGMLQRTNTIANSFINKIMKLQRTHAATNEFFNKWFSSVISESYKGKKVLQRTNATTNSFCH
jgi:hypothetical protein